MGDRAMRTTSTAIAAALAGILMAGTAIADSSVPGDPGAPRRDPAPAATPDFAPAPGGPRPTGATHTGNGWGEILIRRVTGAPPPSVAGDAAVDQMLGVLPGAAAEKEHAKIYIVNDDGEIECWDLDSFLPEPC